MQPVNLVVNTTLESALFFRMKKRLYYIKFQFLLKSKLKELNFLKNILFCQSKLQMIYPNNLKIKTSIKSSSKPDTIEFPQLTQEKGRPTNSKKLFFQNSMIICSKVYSQKLRLEICIKQMITE
jgi:hypothetical protein